MSKARTRAELQALEPRYTVGGLFESGTLGSADETAIEEIVAIRSAFGRWVNPSRGWMTPRFGESAPAVPRPLGNGPAWRRYKEWRYRWRRQLVAPGPSIPWGLTVADVVIGIVTEPGTINDWARTVKMPAFLLVELFVKSVNDYRRTAAEDRRRLW